MSCSTLSSEMVSQWTVQEVAEWFSENGLGSAKRYIKQHKIDGQKLLLNSSQSQKELFGMNEKQTRDLLSKLSKIGIYNNYPSDDSFDEVYQSSDGEYEEETNLLKGKSLCGYLEPNASESQTDFSSKDDVVSLGPPELPPRTSPHTKGANLELNPWETNSHQSEKKVKINEESIILSDTRKFSGSTSPPEEDFDEEYEPVDEVTDAHKFDFSRSSSSKSQIQLPKLPPQKHEPDFPCKPNLPMPPAKTQILSPPKLPPPRKQSNDTNDGLEYEILEEDLQKAPSPPPRPKAQADPDFQVNAESPQSIPNSFQDAPPGLIVPQKYRAPCVPGMPRIEINDLTAVKNQLKTRPTKEALPEGPKRSEPLAVPDIIKPKKTPKVLFYQIDQIQTNATVPRPAEKPNSGKAAVLPPKNVAPPSSVIAKRSTTAKVTDPQISTPQDRILVSLEDEKWYQNVTRMEAAEKLKTTGKNGAFIVRPSTREENKPFVLAVYVDGDIKNIPIRRIPDGKFALGKGKLNEETFGSISELVAHFSQRKIEITTPEGIKAVTLVNTYGQNR